jgi:glycosyltransferase involved in cell wall biosynthesis
MITGVVLARNEELNIVACLEALRPHVAELFLIDMESSDRTIELARPYVDRVLAHPLVANFDAARNMAIPLAAHEWLWFVDADEQVPAETGRQVNELVRAHGDEFEALTVPFKTFFCGHWMQYNGWWPGYTCCRVLKRGHFEFSRWLHGGVQLAGREIRFPASPDTAIAHYSFRSLEHYVEKFNRYTTVEGQQLHERGFSYDWRAAIKAMMQDLWMSYEHHSAWRDGTWGWIVSWQSAQYRWMSYTKLLDAKRALNEVIPESAPESLAEMFEVMEDELANYRRLQPQLPLGLVVHSNISELTNDCHVAATRLLALARLRRPLQWRSRADDDLPTDDSSIDPILWNFTKMRRPGHGLSIFIGGNGVPQPDAHSVYSVYWPIRDNLIQPLPREDLATLRCFDAIWVSSAEQLRRMRRLGIAEERLSIVPDWIDTRIFTPSGTAASPDAMDCVGARILALLARDTPVCERLLEAIAGLSPPAGRDLTLYLGSIVDSAPASSLQEWLNSWQERQEQLGIDRRIRVRLIDLPADEAGQAGLIRAVDGLVVACHGDERHWGLAALACGRPVAAMTQSPLVGSTPVDAWISIPGDTAVAIAAKSATEPDSRVLNQRPTVEELRSAIDQLINNGRSCPLLEIAADVQRDCGEAAGRERLQQAIGQLEDQLKPWELAPVTRNQLRITLEGELFAGHSFSNINEILAEGFEAEETIAIRLERRIIQPIFDERHPRARRIKALLKREFPEGPDITIRHAFPPNWEAVKKGLWVHIQPWEFGRLPRDWLPALRNHVTEAWVPSKYVRDVYVASGIDEEKVKVIPWGCNPDVFRPDAPPALLSTSRTFRFLFVGGTIPRKGFDRLFEAYLREFGRDDDVCLVIKDMGTDSFYGDTTRQHIHDAVGNAAAPEIIYSHDDFLPSQLASLYTACHCLVAPYRGEGFGLPVLEAMACGLPAMVPEGGPTDDFVSDVNGFRLPARQVTVTDMPDLCETGSEFQVSLTDLRSALRYVYENREKANERGQLASREVRATWTWDATIQSMTQRLWQLARRYLKKCWSGTTDSASLVKTEEQQSPSSGAEQIEGIAIDEGLGGNESDGDSLTPLVSKIAPASRDQPRCVLIQMATGAHQQLLHITRKHHESYAARHGMEFWCLNENPAEPKRASWGKITLLLRALRAGYERAIWLDADAVIMRSEVNLAQICDRGIALVQHPNPVHWNAGFLVAAKSPLVERLLTEIDSRPDNDSAWMEQLVLNELAKRPEFRAVLHPLSPSFNATPGAIVVPQPVICAAHGLPFEHRVTLLNSWLREAQSRSDNGTRHAHGFRVRCREEFAEYLNDLGLTGLAVEVGVLRGEFSRLFLDRWKGQRLHLVDPWRNLDGYFDVTNLPDEAHEQAFAETQQNLAAHRDRFEVCRQLSSEAVHAFGDGSLDFVYIDANHQYADVGEDIRRWYPKLQPGGILAGHDFVDGLFPEGDYGVTSAVREFEQQTNVKAMETHEGRWNSWYLYRL